jgi:hypothetical protein
VKLQKSDYGVELGMGFNFYFQSFIFSPEIKLSNGIRNVHSRDENLKYSNVIDRITIKNDRDLDSFGRIDYNPNSFFLHQQIFFADLYRY